MQLDRLDKPASPAALSWVLIFAPIYAAAVLQAILHSFKTLEGGETLFRGREARPRRRPGFALTLDDTLAFNISLHLSGAFYVHNATWSVVASPPTLQPSARRFHPSPFTPHALDTLHPPPPTPSHATSAPTCAR